MASVERAAFTIEELEQQHTAELPPRDLLASVTLFGFPIAGVSDVGVQVNQSGPLVGRIA